MHKRLLPLAALVFMLAGCTADPGHPNWGDQVPDWAIGESWTYSLEPEGHLKVEVVATPTDGEKYQLSYKWSELETGVDIHYVHTLATDSRAIIHTQEIAPRDGETDLQDCPIIHLFPIETNQTICRYSYVGDDPIAFTIYKSHLADEVLTVPYGTFNVSRINYRIDGDIGSSVEVTYAPEIGYFATLRQDVPGDRYGDAVRLHSLTDYHNPR